MSELSDGKPDIKIIKIHLPYTFHLTNLKSTVPALPVGAVQVNSSDVREKALLCVIVACTVTVTKMRVEYSENSKNRGNNMSTYYTKLTKPKLHSKKV